MRISRTADRAVMAVKEGLALAETAATGPVLAPAVWALVPMPPTAPQAGAASVGRSSIQPTQALSSCRLTDLGKPAHPASFQAISPREVPEAPGATAERAMVVPEESGSMEDRVDVVATGAEALGGTAT